MRREINSSELHYLYSKIGEAIWHLQYVENTLASYILYKGIAKELNSLSESEALKQQKRLNKLPLGRLISEAKERAIFDEKTLIRIRSFNHERKWVVHNSIFESGHNLYTDAGRNYIFARLESFANEAISLHKHIGELTVNYAVSKGKNKKQIYETANQQIMELKGEV